HAKHCTNESSAIIGTINMDFRRFYTHFENGVWIPDGDVKACVVLSHGMTEHAFRYDALAKKFCSKGIAFRWYRNQPNDSNYRIPQPARAGRPLRPYRLNSQGKNSFQRFAGGCPQ
ncbi:MAG: alpha/beta hydrolase, partial [Clostridia bacterium]|nr:alpha/beta hydrolase [Clostridia bacterium]